MKIFRLLILLLACALTAGPVYAEPVPGPTGADEQPAAQVAKEAAAVKTTAPGKISLELKNVDIIEVLKLLSRKGNINIITGPNVRGRVTLFLENVSVWDALRLIFETNDLAYTKEEGILKVITGKEYEQMFGRKFDDKRILRIIPIQYADANDVANTIKQTRNVPGTITVDDRTNSLIVLEMPDQMSRVEETVRSLDIPIVPRAFTLQYTTLKTVDDAVKKLLSKKGSVYTDSLTNKVIVSDFPENIEKISQVIAELDTKPYLETKVFSLNYGKYDDIESKLKEIITKDIGAIKSDQRTNKVVVTDFPEKIRKIEALVEAYDEKSREVLIEAKVIEVRLKDDYKFGVDWEAVFNNLLNSKRNFNLNIGSAFEQITQQASTDTLFFRRAATVPGARVIGTGNLTGSVQQLNGVLDALKQIGDTKILSNPRVTAISGQEAVFKVITRQAFVTDTVVQNPAAATTAENVTFIDVGVNLKITPTINPDHYITLKIKPEVSSVTSTLLTAQGNSIPIVSSQELETIVMVKDGVTIILGGLIQDRIRTTTSRVPVLGNMPLVGMLFRKDVHDNEKTELVFFLTPTVVTGDTDFLASSRKLLEVKEEKEKLMWKDDGDIDYPDQAKKVRKSAYPPDAGKNVYPDKPSAHVSPLHPVPPGPNGQLRPAPEVPEPTEKTAEQKKGEAGLLNWVSNALGMQQK